MTALGTMTRMIRLSGNFETAVTTNTTQVMHIPIRLSGSPCFQPGSRRRSQRTTIPACDMVKATKTPMA